MYDFSDISDDLLLFFYRRDNGRCFFPQYCFKPYANSFASEYNMVFIQNLLADTAKIKNDICEYYFPEIVKDRIDFYCDSILETGKLIDESNYSDRIKSKLYSFFVNPASVIQKLNLNLTSMNLPLSKYYEKNYQTIIDLQNQFNHDEFIENVKK